MFRFVVKACLLSSVFFCEKVFLCVWCSVSVEKGEKMTYYY